MSHAPKARFLDPGTPPTLITLILSISLGALSMTVIVPSLTAIATHFAAPYWQVQFLVSGFLLATAAGQLLAGPMSDFLGRRQVLIWSVALFTCASAVAALAPNITILLAARLAQAVIASAMVLSRAAIRDTTSGEKAASRIGYATMAMALIPMVAPALGGSLQEIYDWPAAFWIMATAGGIVWFLIWRDMGETAPGKGQSFGAQVRSYPTLLRTRRFWAYSGAMASGTASFFALLGGTPYLAEQIFDLTPQQYGLYFGMTPMGYLLGNFLVGMLSTRLGLNRLILIGVCIPFAATTLALILAQTGAVHPLSFFGCCVGIGLGNGLVLPTATTGIMNLRPELAGTGAGLSGALSTVTGAVVSAIAASVLGPQNAVWMILCILLIASGFGLTVAILAHRLERRAAVRDNAPIPPETR